jgi:hypothetical protein
MTRAGLYDRITAKLDALNDDELEVVLSVVDGIAGPGRTVYGPMQLASDPRDFDEELRQEVRDGLVYVAMRMTQLKRAGGK